MRFPENFQLSGLGETYAMWTWDEVEGATHYVCQASFHPYFSESNRKINAHNPDPASISTKKRVCMLMDIPCGHTVYLRVRAEAGETKGEWTEALPANTRESESDVYSAFRQEAIEDMEKIMDPHLIKRKWDFVDGHLIRERGTSATPLAVVMSEKLGVSSLPERPTPAQAHEILGISPISAGLLFAAEDDEDLMNPVRGRLMLACTLYPDMRRIDRHKVV